MCLQTVTTATADLSAGLIFEQEPSQILDALLPLYLSSTLLRALQVRARFCSKGPTRASGPPPGHQQGVGCMLHALAPCRSTRHAPLMGCRLARTASRPGPEQLCAARAAPAAGPGQVTRGMQPGALASHLCACLMNTSCAQEALASELAARMNAMNSASDNAKELKKQLSLKFNRQRQAMITTQLIEIVAGADAA